MAHPDSLRFEGWPCEARSISQTHSGASKKVLRQNLRHLEAEGIVVRTDLRDVIPHIETISTRILKKILERSWIILCVGAMDKHIACSSRGNTTTVLRDAASMYKVHPYPIALKVKQEFTAKARAKA
jgi:hypothetical protein